MQVVACRRWRGVGPARASWLCGGRRAEMAEMEGGIAGVGTKLRRDGATQPVAAELQVPQAGNAT